MSTKQTKVKEKDATRFFFQEIFWNSASDIELGSFYTFFFNWAQKKRGLPLVNNGVICDFFLLKFHFHVQGSRPLWLINMFNFFNKI
jgi:hypothetical protein